MQIKNWQTFSNVSLECKNFLVFIGESSTGKSSFMKALLYFFQARNLHKGDIKNPENIKKLETKLNELNIIENEKNKKENKKENIKETQKEKSTDIEIDM